MQKAAAVMQFKLEGQMIARHPEWAMEHGRRQDLPAARPASPDDPPG
jgi:fructose-1,6-bisphosphatase